MSGINEMNPVAILHRWFNENNDYFISICSELKFKDSGREAACVDLETRTHIISICSWNRVLCLDIQITEIESEESSFPHTGECESIEEFKGHLARVLWWLKTEKIYV
ncbi:hypothetical protein CWE13_09505 [Aliidiomarina shirensis]|uniref:Uncharacterized protein n=1 Tax=Aliidiomarina shirensis TaxID=1048642 RepID=A0A432WQQ4_9GAMM|nr:hypothetical protein [Aliidiomarina shirensis]RUO36100.1 hypothetical protein CWE13_09505 [Aliidiomarina shirensis]